jgi:hypothetical protein
MSSEQSPEIRASDAERERTGDLLREATVEGRLTLDEFSERYLQAQQARTRGELDAVVRDLPVAAPVTQRRPASKISAIFSGVDRTGPWQLAPSTQISAIFGGCKLDLRYATISSGVTTLNASVYFGSLELIVPDGVDFEIEAAMIMSGRTERRSKPMMYNTAKPLIRVTGTVVCGSITVRDTPNLGDRLREVATGILNPPRSDQRR